MNKKMMLAAAGLAMSLALSATTETPRWIRQNAISPDGSTIVFSYKGDIYTVPVTGGHATQLTTNSAYESEPFWMADSRHIVFSSMRQGTKDIFLTDVTGGVPKRLTDYAGAETPVAVTADGHVLFLSNIQFDPQYGGFPSGRQLYSVDTLGSRPVHVTSLPLSGLSLGKDGRILYEDYKGYEDPFRKHHTSSVTRDIWLYEPAVQTGKKASSPGLKIGADGKFTRISTYKGEDRNPVFASDGDTFYYISEQDGVAFNVYRSSLSASEKFEKLTSYDKNPVRYLSVAQNGTLAYSYNGDLYTLQPGREPKMVEITLSADSDEKEITKLRLGSGAGSMAVSPDEKEVAVAIRGDIFVTSVEFNTTKRITNTPEQERNVCFSHDGRSLYYSAERNGFWGIYKATIENKDEKLFTYATKIKEELFSEEGETSFDPSVSPDGKWVAYYRNRTEIVIKPSRGGAVKSLLKDVNYSYADGDQQFSWSPDSHYILCNYQAHGGWNNEDVALIDIETGEVTDLTESGYNDGGFRWVLGGKAMLWASDKYGFRSHGSWGAQNDVNIMFFDNQAFTKFMKDKEGKAIDELYAGDKKSKKDDKKEEKKDSTEKVKKLNLNLENLAYRTIRLTSASSSYSDYILNTEGTKLYYIAPLESGRGLLVKDLETNSIKVLEKGVHGSITPSKDGKSIYIFAGGAITKYPLAGGASKKITFTGEFEFKPKAERTYIFDHAWKQVQEKFYDPELHGVDWTYYRDNYRQFLPYINNYFDFQELLSEMLGELNGSHTGARYYALSSSIHSTFGALFDLEYEGDGLKIKEILPMGPLALADPEIKEGDVITAINGQEIKSGEDWFPLVTGLYGKKTAVSVSKGGKKAKEIFVEPIISDNALLYKRWVRRNEEMVEKLSGGKIGYVHVQGMNSPSFREVYSKALGKYRNCDALIVDTRHNGGGWLHEDLASFLNGKAYIQFKPRGQYIGTEPFSKWCKPSCVLIGEDNYSDASGFPYVYKTLGIGKLIGAPVPGTMTAVWWETQVNQQVIFGIPQVGSYGLNEERYLENLSVEPDILVYNDPASVLKGEDKQLEAAVREMLEETKSDK